MISLKKRIIDISYKYDLSHIGSCLSCVSIIDMAYSKMSSNDSFVLSNGHAGLALYVVLEKYFGLNAEELYSKHGVHPNFSTKDMISCSSGSLGLSETIALGMALARKGDNIWLLSSDGGTMEGSFWEALRYKADNNVSNLKWYINANGYGAYCDIDIEKLTKRIHAFDSTICVIKTQNEFGGLEAHYNKLNKESYEKIKNI